MDSINCFHRTCYFRIQRALSGGVGKLLEDLNTTHGSGVLTCDYKGQEFKAFLKWLMRNYFGYVKVMSYMSVDTL